VQAAGCSSSSNDGLTDEEFISMAQALGLLPQSSCHQQADSPTACPWQPNQDAATPVPVLSSMPSGLWQLQQHASWPWDETLCPCPLPQLQLPVQQDLPLEQLGWLADCDAQLQADLPMALIW
jgi:hypothetical protein